MVSFLLLSCVCIKYPDRVLYFGGTVRVMIESIYNNAVIIIIEATAEIEIGRMVGTDGGVVVILVGLSYFFIDVVLDIKIERFSVFGNIKDSLNNSFAVFVDKERKALIYQGQYKQALAALCDVRTLRKAVLTVVIDVLAVGIMRITLQYVCSEFVRHLAYAVNVGVDRAVRKAQIFFGVDDAELREATVNTLGVAANPIFFCLVASCENEGQGSFCIGRAFVYTSEATLIFKRAVLVIAEGHNALCTVKNEVRIIFVR